MKLFSRPCSLVAFSTAICLFPTPIMGENSTCGSLVTYNQYSEVLKSAPSCFIDGCGGSSLTSMSTTCVATAKCYPIWNILHGEYQQNWCTTCHENDRACRIPGWPILNATAACDISPNTWLFGNGGCCINGDEISALSSWIETLCNGTWQDQFTDFDKMAKQDWAQYLLPFNWTIAPENISQPHCPNKARYLGLFAIENLVFLIFSIAYGATTLWVIRGKEKRNPLVLNLLKFLYPIRLIKKGLGVCFKFVCRVKDNEGGTSAVVNTILIAVLFSGIQLTFNFATAYVIRGTPGYSDVPAPLLALLFCARPRLGWLVCLLSSVPDIWLTQYFHLSVPDGLLRGQIAVARVAVSSAMSEFIMQLLGAYSLGKTANIGVVRGFYQHNHLSPFLNGLDARDMYGGAMLWLATSFAIVVMWVIVVVWHAAIMHFFTTTKSWAKHAIATTIPKKRQPKSMRNWRKSDQPPIPRRTRRTPEMEQKGDHGTGSAGPTMRPSIRGGFGSPDLDGHYGIFRSDNGSTATSGLSTPLAYEGATIRPADFPQAAPTSRSATSNPRAPIQRNGYQAVENPEMAYMHRATDFPAQLAPGHRESIQSPGPTHRAEDFLNADSSRTGIIHEDSGYIHRANPPLNPFRDQSYQEVGHEDEGDEDDIRERSPHWDPEEHVPRNFRELQPYILALGFFLGMISYIAQWLFWAGLVYAWGDRFCPPNLASVGTLWSIAGILGLGTTFSLT